MFTSVDATKEVNTTPQARGIGPVPAVSKIASVQQDYTQLADHAARQSRLNDDAAIISFGNATPELPPVVYSARGTLASQRSTQSVVLPSPDRGPALQPYVPYDEQVARDIDQELSFLQKLDADVRQHERTHKEALGPYATGDISYRLTYGPDALMYATSGSVPVDLTPASSPSETIEKARTIRNAALAVDHPSAADHDVARAASRMERSAFQQLKTVA